MTRPRRRTCPRRTDRAQAVAEFAAVVPLVALLLLAVVQVALVARAQVLVEHAAREAARAAAVEPTPAGAQRAASQSAGRVLGPAARVTTRIVDEHVVVELRWRVPTDVVLVGVLVPDVELGATVTMRLESSL